MHHDVNDSLREESVPRWLVVVNVLGALASSGASVVGLVHPTFVLAGSATSTLADIYTQAYAARALPLGAALVFVLLSRRRPGLRALLLVSGLAQVADAAIGLRYGAPGMVVGSTLLAVVHLGSLGWLWRTAPRPATA
jgi:hypothetical protein